MKAFEVRLAVRYMTAKWTQTLLLLVGIGVSVMVMAYIPCINLSFMGDLINKSIEKVNAHVTVLPREKQEVPVERITGVDPDSPHVSVWNDLRSRKRNSIISASSVERLVWDIPGVIYTAPFLTGGAVVRKGEIEHPVTLRGVVPGREEKVLKIAEDFPDDKFPELQEGRVAIGWRLAEKLGVRPGSYITLNTPFVSKNYKVVSLFNSGFYGKDAEMMYMVLRDAQSLLHMEGRTSGIAVRLDSVDRATSVASRIRARTGLDVRTWMDQNRSLLEQLRTFEHLILLGNILIALVAGTGLACVFSVMVTGRAKEIAILRAMGMKKKSVLWIFLFQGLALGITGALMGNLAAYLYMYYEKLYPYRFTAEDTTISVFYTRPYPVYFAIASAFAVVSIILASMVPARRAARLDPIEVIYGQ